MRIGYVVSLAILLALSACAPTLTVTFGPTATATITTTPIPTTTPMPTATPVPPLKLIDACGVTDQPEYLVRLGYRLTVSLSESDERTFCITTDRDLGIPSEFANGNVTILGNIPEPERLIDQDGKPIDYLGVKDYAFTWREADGSMLVLPALYPRRLARDGKIEAAPVLIWNGGADQRVISGWRLELVDRRSGKTILTIPDPFVLLDKNQVLRLQTKQKTNDGIIPARYELFEANDGLAIGSGKPVGIPVSLSANIEPDPTLKFQQISVDGRDFQWALGPFGTWKSVSVISQVPIETFVDTGGQPLVPLGFIGYAFAWAERGGNIVAMPSIYPPLVDGKPVAPVFLCPQCADPQKLNQWQVWLVNIEDNKTAKVIENPFVTLKKDETLIVNSDLGYLQVARQSGATLSPKEHYIGFQLPTTFICDSFLGNRFDSIEDICFYGFDATDLPRFRQILDWLKKATPPWHQYLTEQRPFDIYYEPTLKDKNWYGSAGATTVQGVRGHVSFAERPPLYPMDNLYYVTTLIHEVAHVQDRKAGNHPFLSRQAYCRAMERSAVIRERAFLIYLRDEKVDGVNRNVLFWLIAEADKTLAEGTFSWNPACR